MARILTLILVSIAVALAIKPAHAEPKISALVPRAGDDFGAVNTHHWALERDPDRIVLQSPAEISLLARVEGKLQKTGEGLVAKGHSYDNIGNLGNSRFWLPGTGGNAVEIFEAKRDPKPHLERLKDLRFTRNFRISNGLGYNGGDIVLSLPSGPMAALLRRDAFSVVQWNSKTGTLDSGGKPWDGDQNWHTCPLPRLTAACVLGDGEALIATQGLDDTGTGYLTVFQAFPDTLKPLSVTTENLNDPLVRNGVLSARKVASSRDGKLVVACGAREATLFECNEKKELIHLGLYCAADDEEVHISATRIDGLIPPRLCAAGDTRESIAFVAEHDGGVSLCRYDATTKKLVVLQTVDLNKLLADNAGAPLAVTFAGRYLRIATTRYALIELDFEKGK
ncbi:hypothetical protein [Anatilimnocola floriformis]|uniref:hypothetical protein n=1 Tax=Anatilimnocola floriformis TaxID=2948575 RepID=UPI0020C44CF3|nr:hypothetical protein [Anatilimnocola floriformis]